jgi:2-polyprenyl-6-methoxyphenol hydroxylase-like FAD-dependent oxidoreductase
MEREIQYDVVIVGASIAGCSAAILYGRRGLKVALIDKVADLTAFKKICTHYIQGCGTPTIRRLGLDSVIEACGGIRNSFHMWTPYGGWVRCYGNQLTPHYGFNIRRKRLDPLVREMAIQTLGVSFFPGWCVKELVIRGNRVDGLEIQNNHSERRRMRARLTVAADGRSSTMAELAGAAEYVIPNKRVFFITYYRNLPVATRKISQFWFLDPEVAYALPCDDDLTLLAIGIEVRHYKLFSSDLEKNFVSFFKRLPDGPNMDKGARVEKIIAAKHMHTIFRRHRLSGFTLIGDAMLAPDPYAGVGIGWAFQGAEWLVDMTSEPLIAGHEHALIRAVRRYEKLHRKTIGSHAKIIASYSSGRKFAPPERLLFSAGAKDMRIAHHVDAYLNRVISARQALSPAIFLRALWVNAKAYWQGHSDRDNIGLHVAVAHRYSADTISSPESE